MVAFLLSDDAAYVNGAVIAGRRRGARRAAGERRAAA